MYNNFFKRKTEKKHFYWEKIFAWGNKREEKKDNTDENKDKNDDNEIESSLKSEHSIWN